MRERGREVEQGKRGRAKSRFMGGRSDRKGEWWDRTEGGGDHCRHTHTQIVEVECFVLCCD